MAVPGGEVGVLVEVEVDVAVEVGDDSLVEVVGG